MIDLYFCKHTEAIQNAFQKLQVLFCIFVIIKRRLLSSIDVATGILKVDAKKEQTIISFCIYQFSRLDECVPSRAVV